MPKKKIVNLDEEQEKEEELEWDKKKIIIAFVIVFFLVVGAIFGRKYILGDQSSPSDKSVQGISTQNTADTSLLPSQEDVKQQIAALEAKVSGLSVKDIASSSPQVQQVLQQLKNLPNVPGDVIKQQCENICKGI